MSSPLVSMVIPGKDAAATVGSTLQSVAAQGLTRDELEVIVINDGSTDDMSAVVREYTSSLSIDLVEHAEARGVSAARNEGIRRANGRYITFLDSDDWYGKGHLRNLVDTISRLEVDWVKADYVVANGQVRRIVQAPCALRNTPLDPRDFINPINASSMVDFPNVWSGIYRTDLRDRGLLFFDESLRTSEDRLMTWGLHLGTTSFAVATSHNMFYRKGSSTSLTGVFDERQLDFIRAFRLMFDLVEREGVYEEFGVKVARSFLGILHYQRANRFDSMDHGVRDRLKRESVALLEHIPARITAAALVGFGDKRIRVLKPVLHQAGVSL